MAANDVGGGAPVRGCEGCGGVDDHPRVTHYLAVGDARGQVPAEIIQLLMDNGISAQMLAEIQDPATMIKHHDCCAEGGCPTGECVSKVKKAKGAIGKELLSHLQKTYTAGEVS